MNHRPFILLSVAVCATACLVGCSQQEPKALLLGNWKIRQDTVAERTSGSGGLLGSGGNNKSSTDFYQGITAQFRPDQTFTLTMGVPMMGKWVLKEKKVTLTVLSVAGKMVPSGPGTTLQTMEGELDTMRSHFDIAMPGVKADSTLGFEKVNK